MANDNKNETPIDVGIAPAFPAVEVPNLTTISDASSTTSTGGPIGGASSVSTDLAEVADPNK